MYCPYCQKEFDIFLPFGRCPFCRCGDAGELAGRVMGDFRITALLGRGANGAVYLAQQRSLERPVALKVLKSDLLSDPVERAGFFREARTAAQLDHAGIVHIYSAGSTDDGSCYYAMEVVSGGSLEEFFALGKRFEFPAIMETALQLAGAMDYAWSNFRLIHGDIKPGNLLMLPGRMTVKLADFGLSRPGGEHRMEEAAATPAYAAPEIIENGQAGFGIASDIYAAGTMLYELTAGAPPFTGTPEEVMRAQREDEAPELCALFDGCDPDFSNLTAWMMRKNPVDRPQDWKTVLGCLRGIRSERQKGTWQGRVLDRLRRILPDKLAEKF